MSTLVGPKNIADLINMVSELPVMTPVAVDCETTGLKPYQGDVLRGVCLAFHEKGDVKRPILSFYVPVGYGTDEDLRIGSQQLLFGCLAERKPIYVFHHAKFDLRFLRQLPRTPQGGIYFPVPEPGHLWDTKIVAWLMDENMSNSLGDQASHYFGTAKIDMKPILKERGGWDKLTPEDTATYGALDAELTLRLYETQNELIYEGLWPIGDPAPAIAREFAMVGLLLRMEDRGILVDPGHLDDLESEVSKRLAEIRADFLQLYATDIGSNKQVAILLYETLHDIKRADGSDLPVRERGKPVIKNREPVYDDEGNQLFHWKYPSVAVSELEALESHPVVDKILEYRKLAKTISSYVEPFRRYMDADMRIHPTFWQTGTVTGRFSCSDPNMQTIPREDKLEGVRESFIAPEGYELWEYDLSAAEKRVMASLVEGDELKDLVESGADVHALLAERVFGEGFTGIQRRYAKNIGYGFDYGLRSVSTAMKYIGRGDKAARLAKRILKGLDAMYPQVGKLSDQEQLHASKHGYIAIHDAWPGRYRRFVSEEEGKAPKFYTALNARIQGGIAELMKSVMLLAEPGLDAMGARLCLQVHDSFVIEVPEGRGEWVLWHLQECLDQVNPYRVRQVFDGKPWGDHE